MSQYGKEVSEPEAPPNGGWFRVIWVVKKTPVWVALLGFQVQGGRLSTIVDTEFLKQILDVKLNRVG